MAVTSSPATYGVGGHCGGEHESVLFKRCGGQIGLAAGLVCKKGNREDQDKSQRYKQPSYEEFPWFTEILDWLYQVRHSPVQILSGI